LKEKNQKTKIHLEDISFLPELTQNLLDGINTRSQRYDGQKSDKGDYG
jgi:hypothetical protein